MINIILGVLFLVILVYLYLTNKFDYWYKKNVVSVPTKFVYGSIKDLVYRNKTQGEIMKEIYDAYPEEKIVGIYRYWNPCLLIRDPDIVKHIMIKDFDSFIDRGIELNRQGIALNIFNLDGEFWKSLRSKLSPIFTSGKLKHMMYLMNEQGESFVSNANKLLEKESDMNIVPLIQMFTIGNIGTCAFGIDVNQEDVLKQDNIYKKLDDSIFSLNPIMDIDMMFPRIFKKMTMIDPFRPYVTNFFTKLVKQLLKDRNNAPIGRKDFMDLLLEIKQQGDLHSNVKADQDTTLEINEQLLAAQAFVFYAAGYETTTVTISFLLYELARNPDVQENIVDEIRETLTKTNGEITYESLKDLKYLGHALDEVLRMYPVLDPLQRKLCTANYQIPGTDVEVKEGTLMFVSVRGLHYDEKYFPNPHKFDPERFSEKNKNHHSCAYLPFGVGPRNCIGMRFAQIAAKIFMVYFLRNYIVKTSSNTPKEIIYDPQRVTQCSKNGIELRIEKQSNKF